MNIRRAEYSDIENLSAIYEIIHGTYEDTDDPFDKESIVEFLKSSIDSSSAEIFVAEDLGRLIGVCTFFIFPIFFNKNIKHSTILTLWVSEENRGSGAGRGLLSECEKVSAEHKANKLIVGIHRTHSETQEYFKKAGYRVMDNVFLKEVS